MKKHLIWKKNPSTFDHGNDLNINSSALFFNILQRCIFFVCHLKSSGDKAWALFADAGLNFARIQFLKTFIPTTHSLVFTLSFLLNLSALFYNKTVSIVWQYIAPIEYVCAIGIISLWQECWFSFHLILNFKALYYHFYDVNNL